MRKVRFLTGVLACSCFAQTIAPPVIPDSVSVQAGIPYDRFPQTVLDIYQPKALASGKRPGVLVIHGGGWINGSKNAVVEKFVLPWVAKGFVVANVEYRLAGIALAPAAVNDVLKAAEWFRRNGSRWNVETRHIVVTGGSAGGHLALMVGMTPKKAHLGPVHKVAAVINFYGITDVEDQLQGEHRREYAETWVPEQEGRFELARRLSPMTYIRKDVPPILTIHGNADETVPYEHGVSLTKAVRDAGGDAEMINVPNGGHGFPMEKMNELYVQVFQFLKKRRIMK